MSSAVITVVGEIISCFLKWASHVPRVRRTDNRAVLEVTSQSAGGGYERWSINTSVCSWHGLLDHLHHEAPARGANGTLLFSMHPFLRQTDLLRPPNIQALVPVYHKTNQLLGWYEPSYGPPSLARHGGSSPDSAYAHWIKQSYEILYSR